MVGAIEIPTEYLKNGLVHTECLKRLLQFPLFGSHTVQLPALNYFHLVLDIDLKDNNDNNNYEYSCNGLDFRLSTAEYRQVIGGGITSKANSII